MEKEHIVSRMSILGHPIHPMLIHFPVAALIGLIATDIAFILTADSFWARGGLWLAGIGMAGGWLSGTMGLADLLIVHEIRRLIIAWCHALMAVTLLSLATLNWFLRVGDPELLILPWGLYLSLLSGFLITLTSLLGVSLSITKRLAFRRRRWQSAGEVPDGIAARMAGKTITGLRVMTGPRMWAWIAQPTKQRP